MLQNGIAGALAPRDRRKRIAGAARAPVYGVSDPVVGTASSPRWRTPMDVIGGRRRRSSGRFSARVRRPARPAAARSRPCPFRLRQSRRWTSRQAPALQVRIVRFKPPSLWEQHGRRCDSGVVPAQSGLILALVLQSRSRPPREREAQRHRRELEHMTRVATGASDGFSRARDQPALAAILMMPQPLSA